MPARSSVAKTFTVGAALSRTFSSWGGTLPTLLLLAVVVNLPLIAWQWFTRNDEVKPGWRAESLVEYLQGFVLSGMCIHAVFKRLVREPVRFTEAFSGGMRRIVPLVMNGLIIVAAIAVPTVLIVLAAAKASDYFAILMIPLAIFAYVVLTMMIASPGAIVVEGIGVFAAMKRSAALTSGSRWSIFWGHALLGIISALLVAVGGFASGAFDSKTSPAGFLVLSAFGLLSTTLTATYSTVVYHDLRATKEGVDVRELMRVFA